MLSLCCLCLLKTERAGVIAAAVESSSALRCFLDTPLVGLWKDKWLAHGAFVEEAVPASSFYHILTGYGALIERFITLPHKALPVL